MVTYEEALAIARDLKENISHCCEFTDAYMFTAEGDDYMIGGFGALVILKENGRALGPTGYYDNFSGEMVRDFDV